jgi:hypothetical protein
MTHQLRRDKHKDGEYGYGNGDLDQRECANHARSVELIDGFNHYRLMAANVLTDPDGTPPAEGSIGAGQLTVITESEVVSVGGWM